MYGGFRYHPYLVTDRDILFLLHGLLCTRLPSCLFVLKTAAMEEHADRVAAYACYLRLVPGREVLQPQFGFSVFADDKPTEAQGAVAIGPSRNKSNNVTCAH